MMRTWCTFSMTRCSMHPLAHARGYVDGAVRLVLGLSAMALVPIVAVARTILVAAWHILKEDVAYKDLGGEYFDRLNEERTRTNLVKRLEKLGYEVELKQKQASA